MYSYDRTAEAWKATPEQEIQWIEEDLPKKPKFQAYEDAVVVLGEAIEKLAFELKDKIKSVQRANKAAFGADYNEGPLDDAGFFSVGDLGDVLNFRELVSYARKAKKLRGVTQRWESLCQRSLEQLRRKV